MPQRTKSPDGRPASAPAAEATNQGIPKTVDPAAKHRRGKRAAPVPHIPDAAAKFAAVQAAVERRKDKHRGTQRTDRRT